MKTALKLFVFSIVVFGSCFSPRPISKLNYDTEDITWIQGKAFVDLELDSVIVSIGMKSLQKKKLLLELHVKNETKERIFIDPAKFHMHVPNYRKASRKYKIDTMARDPEKRLLEIQKDISRKEADRSRQQSFLVFSYVAHAGATVAEEFTDTPEAVKETNHMLREESIEATRRSIDDKKYYIEDLQGMNMQVENQYFRKTHINPDFVHYGLIEFQLTKEAYFEIHIEFEQRKYIVGIHQQIENSTY